MLEIICFYSIITCLCFCFYCIQQMRQLFQMLYLCANLLFMCSNLCETTRVLQTVQCGELPPFLIVARAAALKCSAVLLLHLILF